MNQKNFVLVLVFAATISFSWANAQTLRDAVEQVVRTNPEVLASTNRRFAADEGVKQALGAYFPHIDVNAGIGRERIDSADTRALALSDSSFTRKDATVTLTQMLFDGFATQSEVARQRARVDSSAYSVAANAEDLALQTVGTYLEVLRRQDTTAAAFDNLEAHQRIYKQIKLRSESGVGRRADLSQAESRLALAQSNLRQEQSSLQDANITYERLVGTPPQALTIPASPEEALPATEEVALITALSSNPVVKSAEADVAVTRALNTEAKAALSPRLDLELTANHSNDFLGGVVNDHMLMLRLRYSIFRGGTDLARINETKFQILEANETLNRIRRQVQENVSLAYNANISARERIVILQRYVIASASTRESYAKQFSIGQRTLLDLLNAENEYFNARLSYITEQYIQLSSAFRIFAGMGQLLNSLQIALPTDAIRTYKVNSSHH